MRNAYLSAVYDLARDNKQILALVADNGAIVYDKYRRDFPEQFLNFGIHHHNNMQNLSFPLLNWAQECQQNILFQ